VNPPTLHSVLAAADRLRGVAHRTPVATSRTLDERAGVAAFLKCENFQRVGAFKFRGAYNTLVQLTAPERARGVAAFSSGNHAQGVALAAQLLGIAATIVMPSNAPRTKRAATEGYGAKVIEYDPQTAGREEIAARLVEETHAVLVPPYDHPEIIAGQGTAAVELLAEVEELDWLLVPCGGGGLLSGCALAAKGLAPQCRVVGVEPEVADDATRSFRTGVLHTVHNPPTIADGTRTSSLGQLTFPLVRELVADMVTVSEEEIREAVRFLFARTKLVVEPSGALGVAALLAGGFAGKGRVGVILSGGNVDPAVLLEILS
jgi:threonine dehydratase